jgi:hypothetical protein
LNDERRSPVAWSTLLVAALLGYGLFGGGVPLDLLRPVSRDSRPLRVAHLEDVPARLWEDPLLAYERAVRGAGRDLGVLVTVDAELPTNRVDDPLAAYRPAAEARPGVTVRGSMFDTVLPPSVASGAPVLPPLPPDPYLESDESLLLLTMVMPSGRYAEDTENRKRTRYAALSALRDAGYVAHDSGHLGAFQLTSTRTRAAYAAPFERFRLGPDGTGEWKRVLLLWLPSELLGPQPVAVLHDVHASLLSRLGLADVPTGIRIVGPTSSDTLLAMLDEGEPLQETLEPGPEAESCVLADATLLSTWATISWTEAQRAGVAQAYCEALDRRTIGLGGHGCLALVRVTGQDSVLIETLQSELDNRGIDVSADRIALVTEWDTSYGRSFSEAFMDQARSSGDGDGGAPTRPGEGAGVLRFSYLQGLDGRVPSPDGELRDDIPVDVDDDGPIGRRQTDYLRRLQSSLEEGNARFDAIGIIGTDVYDKLLILRALRQQFPDSVFFTTDLDARFLTAEENPWTRNVIVASHFGLTPLGEDVGVATMLPFRGTYQTANYVACGRALRGTPAASSAEDPGDDRPAPSAQQVPERGVVQAAEKVAAVAQPPGSEDGRPDAPAGAGAGTPGTGAEEVAQGGQPDDPAAGGGKAAVPDGHVAAGNTVRLYEIGRTGAVLLNGTGGETRSLGSLPWVLAALPPLVLLAFACRREASDQVFGFLPERVLLDLSTVFLVLAIAVSAWGASIGFHAEGFGPWFFVLVALAALVGTYLLCRAHVFFLAVHARYPEQGAPLSASMAVGASPVVAVAILGVVLCMVFASGRDGEPLYLLEGVSVWPTIALRGCVLLFGISGLLVMAWNLQKREVKIGERLGLCSDDYGAVSWKAASAALIRSLKGSVKIVLGQERVALDDWTRNSGSKPAAQRGWEAYCAHANGRLERTLRNTMLFSGLLLLAHLVEAPQAGVARGLPAQIAERATWFLAIPCVAMTIFYVYETTLGCCRFLSQLASREGFVVWSRDSRRTLGRTNDLDPGDAVTGSASLDPLLDVRLAAHLTEEVSRLVWLPAALLLALVLAQNTFFDSWAWSRTTVLLTAFAIVLLVVTAARLRGAAERLRRRSIQRLRETELYHKIAGDPDARHDELGHALSEITGLRRGAFLPFAQHPIVVALMLPFGGVGTLAILERMAS